MCEGRSSVGSFSLKLLDSFLKLFSFAALLSSHFCDDCVLYVLGAVACLWRVDGGEYCSTSVCFFSVTGVMR
jgi:uncharacterized membrane protein YqjE